MAYINSKRCASAQHVRPANCLQQQLARLQSRLSLSLPMQCEYVLRGHSINIGYNIVHFYVEFISLAAAQCVILGCADM